MQRLAERHPMRLHQRQQLELADPIHLMLVQAEPLVLPVVRLAVNSSRYRQADPMLVLSGSVRPIRSHLH
jgi:hypothetical protein